MAQEHVPRTKKKAAEEGAVVLFEDEAVFQQEGTIIRTWGPIGKGVEIKSKPVRRSAKVFGAVSVSTPQPKFHFRFIKDTFNNTSFIIFLEQLLRYYSPRHQKIYLIVDGVSYHKKALEWTAGRSNEIELHFLPPYSPNLNPVEQIWRRTKAAATHNRYFSTIDSLRDAIFRRFNRYQGNPASIQTTVESWS